MVSITFMKSTMKTEFGEIPSYSITADIKTDSDIEMYKKFLTSVFGKMVDNADVKK